MAWLEQLGLEEGQERAPDEAGPLPSATWSDTVSTRAQVAVSFLLSLELLSYQKLPADQMLPGVDIQEHENGEKTMVFTQNLLLGFTNQTIQACSRMPPATSNRRAEGGTLPRG